MDNEAYRDLGHHETRDLIMVTMRERGMVAMREVRLPNNTIADVAAMDRKDDIYIFEVKTLWKASLAESAWRKYYPFCNYLYVVVPGLTQSRFALLDCGMIFTPVSDAVGVMSSSRDEDEILKPAQFHTMQDSVKRAVRDALARADR